VYEILIVSEEINLDVCVTLHHYQHAFYLFIYYGSFNDTVIIPYSEIVW